VGELSEHRTMVGDLEVFWRRASPDAGGAPVVYLHGVPTNSDDWLPFLERTGGVAPDLPGFGRSDKPQGFDYSIAGYDRFLEAFLDSCGIERFSLVLHDWGVVGLATAQRLHERLDKLVMFSCVPLLPGYRWHRIARVWRRPLAGEMFMGLSTRWAFKQLSKEATAAPGPLPDSLIDSVWAHFDHGTQRAILKLYRSAPPEVLERAGAALGDITAPALLLWPQDDPYIGPQFGRAYADALGGEVRLEEVPRAGHWSWLDRPEQVDEVATFLRT
jgi:pimeloyl-ACP methyl ester carboxylesterase